MFIISVVLSQIRGYLSRWPRDLNFLNNLRTKVILHKLDEYLPRYFTYLFLWALCLFLGNVWNYCWWLSQHYLEIHLRYKSYCSNLYRNLVIAIGRYCHQGNNYSFYSLADCPHGAHFPHGPPPRRPAPWKPVPYIFRVPPRNRTRVIRHTKLVWYVLALLAYFILEMYAQGWKIKNCWFEF